MTHVDRTILYFKLTDRHNTNLALLTPPLLKILLPSAKVEGRNASTYHSYHVDRLVSW